MTEDSFFKTIASHYQEDLPFVAYRKPGSTLVKALLQNNNNLYTTQNFSESGFVFAPFNDVEASVLMPIEKCETISGHFESLNAQDNLSNSKEINIGRDEHINLVKKGIDAIENGELKKVVLSRQETIDLNEYNALEIFKRLLSNYNNAFVYCWFHTKVGLWLGATPETLLKIENNRLQTMALAGTQEYKGSLDVKWSTKDIDEQQFVSDYVVEALSNELEDLSVSETQTVKAGSLLHLKTTINAVFKPKDLNLKQLVSILHPTPAVCGIPKQEAFNFIINNENYKREFYTGILGELNLKEQHSRNTNRRNVENNAYSSIKNVTHLFVNLRCMQIKENIALLYVGGGITKDSNPELEWEETVNKSKVIKKVL